MSHVAPERDALLLETQRATQTQRRRMTEMRAREHVGAAGWAQSSALEGILKLGREGLATTDSLRQVVNLTTEQLRQLSMASLSQTRAEHQKALQDIVSSGEEQLTASQALEEMLCQALEDICDTPLEQVNVHQLEQIRARVQQQMSALNVIIDTAKAQAETLEQVSALEKVNLTHQERLNAIDLLSAEEQVSTLGDVGEKIVEDITQIDEAHPQQLEALKQIGHAVVEGMPETGAAAAAQADTLEQLAQAAKAQASKLRQEK